MKAASIYLTLLLSCASTGTGGVETWGWDEHVVMWQCLARCYQKLFQHIKYLSPAMLSLPFSCFEVMSHSWWTGIVLFPGLQLNLSRSDPHHCFASKTSGVCKALHFPVRWQCIWFQMATLWRVSPRDGQRHSKCPHSRVGWWKHEGIARVAHSCVKTLSPRSARFVPLLSSDSSCVLAVCRDSMKAALAGSLLRISCGVTHGSSVGMWGWEAHLVIWRC